MMIKQLINDSIYDIVTSLKFKVTVDVGNLTGEERLKEELGFDSLDTMEVIMAVEHRSGIKIPNKRIKDIFLVKDIYHLFEEAA